MNPIDNRCFPSGSARDSCNSNVSERRSCESHALLCELAAIVCIFCFLFVNVVLTFELRTNNFWWEGLSLMVG